MFFVVAEGLETRAFVVETKRAYVIEDGNIESSCEFVQNGLMEVMDEKIVMRAMLKRDGEEEDQNFD